MRGIVNIKPEELTLEGMDIFNVFYHLAKSDYIFLIDNYTSWCRDIKFNYRDKAIYIPYYKYEEKMVNSRKVHKHLDTVAPERVNVRYNFDLCFKPIFIGKELITKEIKVFDREAIKVYTINLENRQFYSDIFSISTLYKYYLNASYFDEAWDAIDFTNKYHWIKSCKGENYEYALRANNHLPHIKEHTRESDNIKNKLLNFTDIRLYSLETIQTMYNFNLDVEMQYWERKFLFDAYLLTNMLQENEFVEEAYNKQLKKLGKSLDYFKYDESNFPMYLKHYYKVQDFRKRASYEGYLSGKSLIEAFE